MSIRGEQKDVVEQLAIFVRDHDFDLSGNGTGLSFEMHDAIIDAFNTTGQDKKISFLADIMSKFNCGLNLQRNNTEDNYLNHWLACLNCFADNNKRSRVCPSWNRRDQQCYFKKKRQANALAQQSRRREQSYIPLSDDELPPPPTPELPFWYYPSQMVVIKNYLQIYPFSSAVRPPKQLISIFNSLKDEVGVSIESGSHLDPTWLNDRHFLNDNFCSRCLADSCGNCLAGVLKNDWARLREFSRANTIRDFRIPDEISIPLQNNRYDPSDPNTQFARGLQNPNSRLVAMVTLALLPEWMATLTK